MNISWELLTASGGGIFVIVIGVITFLVKNRKTAKDTFDSIAKSLKETSDLKEQVKILLNIVELLKANTVSIEQFKAQGEATIKQLNEVLSRLQGLQIDFSEKKLDSIGD